MNGARMQRKRPATRIDTELKASSIFSGLQPDSRIINLSTSGAFIQTTEPLPVETIFALNFRLPGDSMTISVHARVVWSRSTHSLAPPGIGIQFTNIAPDHKNKLADFIEQNCQPNSIQEQATVYV
jgi:uncharacterized protein (TIGR02266 family)